MGIEAPSNFYPPSVPQDTEATVEWARQFTLAITSHFRRISAFEVETSGTHTYITTNAEAALPNARVLTGSSSILVTDNGASSTVVLSLIVAGLPWATFTGSYATSAAVGSLDNMLRSNAVLPFPQAIQTSSLRTITASDDSGNIGIIASTGSIEFNPGSTGATADVNFRLGDKAGNPGTILVGDIWRFGTATKIATSTLVLANTDDANARTIIWQNSQGFNTLSWTPTTLGNFTMAIPNRPGELIHDGESGTQLNQTMKNKRFLDASNFIINDSDGNKGMRFQVQDVISTDLEADHAVINIPVLAAHNPSQSDMVLADIAQTFTGANTFTDTILTVPPTDTTAPVSINFGDKTANPITPNAGDMWRNGTALNYERATGTTIDLTTQLISAATNLSLTLTDDATDGTLTLSGSGDLYIETGGTGVAIPDSLAVGSGTAPSAVNRLTVAQFTADGTTSKSAMSFSTLLNVTSGAFGADFFGVDGSIATTGSVTSTGAWTGVRGGFSATGGTIGESTSFKSRLLFTEVALNITFTEHTNFLSDTPSVNPIIPAVSTLTTGYGFRHKGWATTDLTVGTGWAVYVDADDSYLQNVLMDDSIKLKMGTGQDSETYHDGSNHIIDPDVVGSGRVLIGATGDDDMKLNKIEIDSDLNHDGGKAGFFGVDPVVRPSAFTQTYTTSDHTHDAKLSSNIVVTPTNSSPWGYTTEAAAQAIEDEINNLSGDVTNIKNVINSIIDDLQTLGLLQ